MTKTTSYLTDKSDEIEILGLVPITIEGCKIGSMMVRMFYDCEAKRLDRFVIYSHDEANEFWNVERFWHDVERFCVSEIKKKGLK